MQGLGWALDAAAREVLLFAAFGFLVGGLDDLLVDLVYLVRRVAGPAMPLVADLPRPETPGRLAVFVPAWDEVAVIAPMLRATVSRYRHGDYRIFVGCYPNDRATIDAVASVAAGDDRVRLVIGAQDGPTTKGCNLNTLWQALLRADAAERRRTRAVVLHDAEDVVHPDELCVVDALIGRWQVVQLPVRPLVRRTSVAARLVSGSYADEFAESHAKSMVVRRAVGAAMPLAGVGCAIATEALEALAARRGGLPFDPSSLVEDYEMGLHLAEAGARGCFARVAERPGGPPVATEAYFPDTLEASVRQKARWMTGIALAGWDRTGWGRALALPDHWMRARDRRAPLAVLVLAAAYAGGLLWAAAMALEALAGVAVPALDPVLAWLLRLNAGLLLWRVAVRTGFTAAVHGVGEACWAPPRLLVANWIALMAVARAMRRYLRMLGGAAPVWDKTAHRFPELRPE